MRAALFPNVRTAMKRCRVASGGPSGITTDHTACLHRSFNTLYRACVAAGVN